MDLKAFSRVAAGFFTSYDVWLTPTLAAPPLPVGAKASTSGDPWRPARVGGRSSRSRRYAVALSVVGPLLGGVLVDNLSWRWIFYINVPIRVIALGVVASQVPGHLCREHHVIDDLGTLVLSVAATSLILLTSLGGTTYPWRSAPIYILGMAGLIGVFALAGRRAADRQVPVLPQGRFRGDNTRMRLLSLMGVGSSTLQDPACMLVVGMGIGGVMQVLVIIVQNGVPQRTGLATSDTRRLRSFANRSLTEKSPLNHCQLVISVDAGGRVCSAIPDCRSAKRGWGTNVSLDNHDSASPGSIPLGPPRCAR